MGGGDKLPTSQPYTAARLATRVLTHNIRYAATSLFPQERPWLERLPGIMREFHHYSSFPFNLASTIICLQEVLDTQLQDIVTGLSRELSPDPNATAWDFVGVGRDDGRVKGEFNPIFYRPSFWKKVHFETIWLSETPDQVSRGWDGGSNRICTCLVLRSHHSRIQVMILNTHLDNAGPIARREGAKLIIGYARKWQEQFNVSRVVLTGDLNSTKEEESGAWQILNEVGSGFVDTERLLEGPCDVRHFGGDITFTGFDGNGDEDEVGLLDFVHLGVAEDESMVQLNGRLSSHTIVPNVFERGIRCSDHRAVVVDLLL